MKYVIYSMIRDSFYVSGLDSNRVFTSDISEAKMFDLSTEARRFMNENFMPSPLYIIVKVEI